MNIGIMSNIPERIYASSSLALTKLSLGNFIDLLNDKSKEIILVEP